MSNTFSVAVNYHDILGYIEYDGDKKEARVTLPEEEGRKLTEDFLHTPCQVRIPRETLLDFTEETIDPLASVRHFQTALTKLWEATGVHVDWSRPVEFVKKYPRLADLPKGGIPFDLPDED